MSDKEKEVSINIQDVKEVLELFGKLDDRKKEIALAALTGMTLVVDCDKSA